MSISAWPSIEPSRPFSASARASSTSWRFRKRRKRIARKTIISGPPTNSPSTNCQPSRSAMMIPSSITRLVEANSNAIAAVKSAPLAKQRPRKRDRGVGTRRGGGAEAGRDRERLRRIVGHQTAHLALRDNRLDSGRERETENQRPQHLPGHAEGEAERPPELVPDRDGEDQVRRRRRSRLRGSRCSRSDWRRSASA